MTKKLPNAFWAPHLVRTSAKRILNGIRRMMDGQLDDAEPGDISF
jgi:hypothetical protein